MRGYTRLFSILLICAMPLTTGCATLSTAAHFTGDSPLIYSGTRLDIHASAGHEDVLRSYKENYGVEPPADPELDLPFSMLFDTIILIPVVIPVALYKTVFD